MKIKALPILMCISISVSAAAPAATALADERIELGSEISDEFQIELDSETGLSDDDLIDESLTDDDDSLSEEEFIIEEIADDYGTGSLTETPAEGNHENETPRKKTIDGKYYLIYKDGSHYTGWYKFSNGKKIYCNPKDDGAFATGYIKIKKRGYLFSKKGNLYVDRGLIKANGNYYYVSKSGVLSKGWKSLANGDMYFSKVNHAACTGIKTINGNKYYFNKKGIWRKTRGYLNYNGYKYWVKKDGTLGCGWIKKGSRRLYFSKKTYRAVSGLKKINGRYYMFDKKAVRLGSEGVCEINGLKYWCAADAALLSGWRIADGIRMYFYPDTLYCATGTVDIDGRTYTFDDQGVLIPIQDSRQLIDGRMYYYNGYQELYRDTWVIYNGEKIYVDGNGIGLADLSDQIGGPYTLYVDRANCVVTAYSYDGRPVRSMLCSVGLPGMNTPAGHWQIFRKYALKELMGPSWGKWACNVDNLSCGGIYFHSVATFNGGDPTHSVPTADYNNLGNPASHGCIRLCVRDAKWIYDHCSVGTSVIIGDYFALPFGRPFLTQISGTVDPTDPEA